MKLVDILARELKEWPSDNADDYCLLTYEGNTVLFLSEAHPLKISQRPEDCLDLKVTRSQWQAAVDALKAGEQVQEEWSGDGTPPVGIICERRTHPEALLGRYEQVRIIAHTSKGFPVWESTDGMFAGISKTQRMGDYPEFRRSYTTEQIAIGKLRIQMLEDVGLEATLQEAIEKLVDLGYRKQEIQP